MDGTGYPDGLSGAGICIEARIIAVCDAFASMTSERSYRGELAPAAAIAELRRCAGPQFDPEIVELLASAVDAAARQSKAA
jgi:HD-GYP domain-containing protein (c-di-GMP phosphodiesterase class II)